MIDLIGALAVVALQAVSLADVHRAGIAEDAEIRTVEFASDGSVWVPGGDQGLAHVGVDEVSWSNEADGLMSNGIADLAFDSSGRLWIAGLNGVAVLDGGSWTATRSVGEWEPRVVFGIHEDALTGAIWFGSSAGAARLHGDSWETVTQSDGLPHAVVHAVLVDSTGTTWFACRRGLARSVHGTIESFFPDLNFRSAVPGNDGAAWFGSSGGVFEWDGSDLIHHLPGSGVYPKTIDDEGTVWAVTDSEGIFSYDGSAWETHDLPAAVSGAEVFDLAFDTKGRLWAATSRGLVVLEDL